MSYVLTDEFYEIYDHDIIPNGTKFKIMNVTDKQFDILSLDKKHFLSVDKRFVKEIDKNESGTKHDSGKPRISLIPKEALFETANAFGFGAEKYGTHNFKGGIKMSRLLDAALRHIVKYADGEDMDDENPNTTHLGHAMAALSMAIYMHFNKPELDDRFKK